MKNVKSFINTIEDSIYNMKREIELVDKLDSKFLKEQTFLIEQIEKKFFNIIKDNIDNEKELEHSLNNIYEELQKNEIDFLNKFIEKQVYFLNNKVNSFLWYGERTSNLEQLDIIKNDLISLKKSNQNLNKVVKELRNKLDIIQKLNLRIMSDEKRSQFTIPFKILLWGLPIIIGIWASKQFTDEEIFIYLFLLLIFSVSSYFFNKFKLININILKNILNILKKIHISSVIIPFIFLLMFADIGITMINKYIAKSTMNLVLENIKKEVKKGELLNIPYSLNYKDSIPAVDVNISVNASGLTNNYYSTKLKAISNNKSFLSGFNILIPEDIPSGVYIIEIDVAYEVIDNISFSDKKKRTKYYKEKSFEINVL